MGSLRKRYAVMEAVAMKMVEEGRVLSKHDYDNCKTVPIRSALVLNHFGSWTRLVSLIEKDMPKVWEEIQGSEKQEAQEEPPKQKKDPLAALSGKPQTKGEASEESEKGNSDGLQE